MNKQENIESTVEKNIYALDSKSIELREWCNANIGRTSLLTKEANISPGLSHYKYGRNKISDSLWKKLKRAMSSVELTEKNLNVKLRPTKRNSTYNHSTASSIYYTAKAHLANPKNLESFNKFFGMSITLENMNSEKEFIISNYKKYYEYCWKPNHSFHQSNILSWLNDNGKVKTRLANIVYGYNYRNNCYDNGFSNIVYKLKSNKQLSDKTLVRCDLVIKKVDEMIKNNHAVAIAASK